MTLKFSSNFSAASKDLPFLLLKPLIVPVLPLVSKSVICLSDKVFSLMVRKMIKPQFWSAHFATFGKNRTLGTVGTFEALHFGQRTLL